MEEGFEVALMGWGRLPVMGGRWCVGLKGLVGGWRVWGSCRWRFEQISEDGSIVDKEIEKHLGT